MPTDAAAVWGVLLPQSTLNEHWFEVLAAFVAVNTLVYVTLALAKSLPRVHLADWVPRRRSRRETRSIHPDGPR